MSTVPEIVLDRFEGPLDLLLSLVRRNAVDVADIPIAEITRQYLDYLHQAGELDLELGSEFVYMAALLIQIKSRCLLPPDPQLAPCEPDPRQELVRQLLSHDQMRQGAEFLREKLELAEATWSRSPLEEILAVEAEREDEDWPSSPGALNLLQVLRLAQQALAAARTYELVTPADPVNVAELMRWLEARVAAHPSGLEAEPLLAEQPDGPHRMALFLAMLELVKSARIDVEQQECFGPIWIAPVTRVAVYGTTVP